MCLRGGADALMLICEPVHAVQGFPDTMEVVRSSLLRLDNWLPVAVGAANATSKGKPTSKVLQELATRVPLATLALGGALWLGASKKAGASPELIFDLLVRSCTRCGRHVA